MKMSYNCTNILKWTEAQLKYTYDVTLQEATPQELHEALGEAVMMAISDNWSSAKKTRLHERKAYYFSAEYLIGRLVYSNLFNLGILDEMKKLFADRGVDLAVLEDIEDDALGNGGLGRLAACFLDSAASTDIPLSGYGLRYKFGLFKQSFDGNGNQVEKADDWTKFGDPWSFRRYNHTVKVKFPDHTVLAVPYDVPVIGYGTENVGTLRLWQCEAIQELQKSEGVSMGGGCLWSFIPILILFPLFAVIRQPITYILMQSADTAKQIVEVIKTAAPDMFTSNAAYEQVVAAQLIPQYASELRAAIPGISETVLAGINFDFLGINLGAVPQFNVFSASWAWDWARSSW